MGQMIPETTGPYRDSEPEWIEEGFDEMAARHDEERANMATRLANMSADERIKLARDIARRIADEEAVTRRIILPPFQRPDSKNFRL